MLFEDLLDLCLNELNGRVIWSQALKKVHYLRIAWLRLAKHVWITLYRPTVAGVDLTAGENLTLLKDVFLVKEVPIDLLKGFEDQYELHRLDWPAVRDSVSPRPGDFDFYFDFVLGEVGRILKTLRVE